MGVVVHSYGIRWKSTVASSQYPGFANAIDLLDHCHQIGAGGIQVGVNGWNSDFTQKVRDRREKLGLYLEGSIGVPNTDADLPRFEQEVRQAREAGATVLRTVCSAGRRYETYHSEEAFTQATQQALTNLRRIEPVLRRHRVRLGVENHKDWRSGELADMMKALSSEWIGVTLDFGNNIALLEDSLKVARTLAPFLVSTHVKDMALSDYKDGFLLSEVPLGQGVLDLPSLIAICQKQRPEVTFNLEMITRDPLQIPCRTKEYWETLEPVARTGDLDRTLKLIQQTRTHLPRISPLNPEERLAAEEQNIRLSLAYSRDRLALR